MKGSERGEGERGREWSGLMGEEERGMEGSDREIGEGERGMECNGESVLHGVIGDGGGGKK